MGQTGIYNELKPAWWYAREGKLPDAPKQVQVILSDLCNQDCHFCAYRMSGYSSNQLFVGDSKKAKVGHNNPVRWMPTERAWKLLEELKQAGVLSVQFTGGGEPCVHPQHEQLFARALALGLRCSLVSNGVNWSPYLASDILPKFDWVRVSVDSANKESYCEIRRCPEFHWDKMWNNVSNLVSSIKRNASNTTFGLGFVVTPVSYKQILRFTELAKATGVNNVRFTAMFSTDDEQPFIDIYEDVRALIGAARKMETKKFSVYDNFGSRFDDLRQHSPDYRFCSYQHYTSYIGGDLQAYRCCVLAYNKRGRIPGGDLSERSFVDFWNSPERKDNFSAFNAKGCARCQFNGKNRAMNYLMDDDPAHKEWP